jgi:hypothetical protein
MLYQSRDSSWKSVKSKKLDESKRIVIEKYFELRRLHCTKDSKLYFSNFDSFKNISLKINNDFVIGIFPNVVWDGNIEGRNTIFAGLCDWLIKTIQFVSKMNHRLIIRFHPSEHTNLRGTINLECLLKKQIPSIDEFENIILISSSENINTYDLFDHIDVGIVYSGTLGMELAFHNIPVISCARGVYHGAGFAYEPKSLREYKKLLADVEWVKKDFEKRNLIFHENLVRFAYWYFMINNYSMPIIAKDYPPKIDFEKIEKSLLDPSSNSDIFRTLKIIKSYIA